MHETTPKYYLLQAEKTANIVQLTSDPLNFEKLVVASAGTTNLVCVCVGGGDTLKILYVRRRGLIVLVQYFEFQYFWGFSKK